MPLRLGQCEWAEEERGGGDDSQLGEAHPFHLSPSLEACLIKVAVASDCDNRPIILAERAERLVALHVELRETPFGGKVLWKEAFDKAQR